MSKVTKALKLSETACLAGKEAAKLMSKLCIKIGHYELAAEFLEPNGFDSALDAIKEAMSEQQVTTPDVCGEVCARANLCYGCNKSFDEALAKKAPEWVDLTDDEIEEIGKSYFDEWSFGFARAVIAAHKEKNK